MLAIILWLRQRINYSTDFQFYTQWVISDVEADLLVKHYVIARQAWNSTAAFMDMNVQKLQIHWLNRSTSMEQWTMN